jgi:hypothetical protein
MYGYGYKFNTSIFSRGVAYDADAQAFFTANFITDTTLKNVINTFFTTCKIDGTYSKLLQANLHFLGSASKNIVNLVNPSNAIAYSSGWTFNSSGATPNGTSAYISTGIIPAANSFLQQNSMHYSYYGRTNGVGALIGGFSNSRGYIIADYGGSSYLSMNSTSYYSGSPINTQGFLIYNRISSTTEKLFKNGSAFLTNSITSTGKDDGEICIGAVSRFGGVFSGSYTNVPCSFSSVGLGFTDTEASNFSTAVNTMMTSLGINIY